MKKWNHLTSTTSFLTSLVTIVVNDVNIVTVPFGHINHFYLHSLSSSSSPSSSTTIFLTTKQDSLISKFSFFLSLVHCRTHYEMTTKGVRIKSTSSSAPTSTGKKTDSGSIQNERTFPQFIHPNIHYFLLSFRS